MLPSYLIDQATGALATAFVSGLWQGAAFTLLAAGMLRLMPRASASLKHTLLLVSFLAALLLPFLHLNALQGASASPNHALPIASWIAAAVALLWIAAGSARALQLLMAWRHLRRVRREATPIDIVGLMSFPAGNRQARLCSSPAVDSPTILGFLKPALLLPEWMVPGLTKDDLQQIALHECEHLRRHDDWLNLMLQLGLTMSPLNPCLLWLNRRISVQRELACDEAVVASTGQPIAYASCLARLAEQRLQQRGRLRLALAAWERRSELAQRVHALLQQPARWSGRQSGMASCAAAALLLLTSAILARAPRLVRILPAPAAAVNGLASVQAISAPQVARAANSSMASSVIPMVPVSFSVKTASLRYNVTGKHRRVGKLPPQLDVTNQIAKPFARPHVLRTSADVLAQPTYTADFEEGVPVRFVTAEFSTPYVAVPVPNGWLLIQL